MPCSAVTVDYRRESTTMPVPAVRPFETSTDYTRPKYSGLTSSLSSSYSSRRTSITSSKQSSHATDTSRYSSARTGLGIRSTSLTDDTRDRSQTRESSRSTRDSSRSRLSSYSSDTSGKSTLRKINYTTFDLNEFRSTYAPSNYVTGTSRTAATTDYSRPPKSSSISVSTASSECPRIKPSLVAKEKRSEGTEISTANLEVIRDENYNVTPEEKKLSGGECKEEAEVKVVRVDDGDVKDGGSDESSELQDNLSPRFTRATGVGTRRDIVNDNNGLSGLRNIGNTCFLNSVVQCLSNTRILKDYLINREYSGEITSTESKGALIKSFADVICELWSGEGKVVNTTAFKAQIQRYAPRFMGYNQQDAQEFLRYLLQGLHDDINRVTVKPRNLPPIDDNLSDSVKASESWKQYLRCDNSRIVDLFVGQLKSTLQCTACGHCSTTFEVFWDLSLPLPSRSGSLRLSQCLDHFTKEEVLDGDEMPTCSKCKTRRKCTKRFSIQKFPKILVLHLKRFSPSERYRKLSATVEFPLSSLDMSAYSSTPQTSSYNLYAVSNHSGTAYSGHYTAYCLHPHSGQWHEYNDSRVTSVSGRNVVSSEAYILFYEQTTGVTTSRL